MSIEAGPFSATLIIAILMVFAPSISLAWSRHDLLVENIIDDHAWPESLGTVTVTERPRPLPDLNPDFLVEYAAGPEHRIYPRPGEFVAYDTDFEHRFGWSGAEVGRAMPPADILRQFADEPDWGLDKDLDLGAAQGLMGGSQGYRHMLYPSWGAHVPFPWRDQGAAHERLALIYSAAKDAFNFGDNYWGWRLLAWCVHYIQDLAQPYHTVQLPRHCFYRGMSFIDGSIQSAKNYHFAFETFVGDRLSDERDGLAPLILSDALRNGEPMQVPAEGLEAFALLIADQSAALGDQVFPAAEQAFGPRMRSTSPVKLTADEYAMLNRQAAEGRGPGSDLLRSSEACMDLAGRATRGFLEFARADIDL